MSAPKTVTEMVADVMRNWHTSTLRAIVARPGVYSATTVEAARRELARRES